MTTSEKFKARGIKSLALAAELSGFEIRTLQNMDKNYPDRFETILIGTVYKLHRLKKKQFECMLCGHQCDIKDLVDNEACPNCLFM